MLLLSEDVLLSVLEHLPRGYMDQLLASNSILLIGIERLSEPNTAIGPLRRVRMAVTKSIQKDELDVRLSSCHPDQRDPVVEDFIATQVVCRSSDALQRALVDSVVAIVEIFHISDATLHKLLPFVHHWQHGTVRIHPGVFRSQSLFEQFFDQLAVTHGTLEIDLSNHPQYAMHAGHLWARTAVKQCEHLQLSHMPSTALIHAEQVIDWLKVPHATATKKSVCIFDNALATTTNEFLDAVKTDFAKAVDPCPCTIKVQDAQWLSVVGTTDTLANATTREDLRIHNDGFFYVLDRVR